jgi:uncharacterized protein involved in exopolysaccharide biosynthesis
MADTMLVEKRTSLKEIVGYISMWVNYLRRNLLIIFIMGVVGGGAGLIFSFLGKTTYTANLSFAMEEDNAGVGGLGGAIGLASSFGLDIGGSAGGAFSGANIIELMKSRRIIEKTLLDSFTINDTIITFAEYYIAMNKWRKQWANTLGLNQKIVFPVNADRNKFSLQQDSVLGVIFNALLDRHVSISQKDKKVSILSITVRSEDEKFSKYFAEAIADEVSGFYIETKSKKAKMNVEILEHQVDSVRAQLNNAITGVASTIDQTYNLNPAFNVQRAPSTRRQVDVQANTAILTQLVVNLELARVSLRKETPLIQIIDKPVFPLTKDRYGKMKSMIYGGLILSIVTVLFLIVGKFFKDLMQ